MSFSLFNFGVDMVKHALIRNLALKFNQVWMLLLFICVSQLVFAQTSYFRVLKGIPHLPVFANAGSVATPLPGMIIYTTDDATVMVFSGNRWENFSDTREIAQVLNSDVNFRIVDGIPVLPVKSVLTAAVRTGAVYFPTADGGVRVSDGGNWQAADNLIQGGETSNSADYLSGNISGVDGLVVFPVLSSAPKDVEAGAVYFTNRFPRLKVYDGLKWKEVSLGQYPGTPLPLVKIGGVTWAPVNAGYEVTRPYGLLFQWHRKYGQEYLSTGNTAGTALLSDGSDILNANRFYTYGLSPFDWCNIQQPSWDMTVGYNPCPTGWRVPTDVELESLRTSGSVWVSAGGPDDLPGRWFGGNYNTDRKGSVFLPAAGYRDNSNGSALSRNTRGDYWTTDVTGNNAYGLDFNSTTADRINNYRAFGYSVRCVKQSYTASITASGPLAFCIGGSVTLTATEGVSYLWSTGETTQEITVTTGGDYSVTVTFADGSSSTSSITTVSVYSMPFVFALTGSPTTICVGETTTYRSSTTGGYYSAYDTDVASVNSSNGVITGVGAGSTYIYYSKSNGYCTNSVSKLVTVIALPVLGGANEVCAGLTANVTPNTGGTWVSDDPTVATITNGGLVTGVRDGTVTLTFTLTSTGCKNTKTFTVKALPVLAGPTSVCVGSTINVTPNSGGTWISSDPTKASVTNAGLVTGVAAGTVTLTYTKTSTGCINTKTVTVYALPVLAGAPVCIGSTTNFTPSTGGTWSSSDPSKATVTNGGVVTGVAVGSVTFTYTETATGCSNSITLDVAAPPVAPTVEVLCIPESYHYESAPVLAHSEVRITGLPSPSCSLTQILPSVGTAENISTTDYTLYSLANGTYTYRLTNEAGCSVDFSFSVCCPKPVIADKSITICGGSFVITPEYINGDIVPDGTTYTWPMPALMGVLGGHAGTNQGAIFDTGLYNNTFTGGPGARAVYTVTPTANGCVGNPFTVTVDVRTIPHFSVSDQTYCAGTTVPSLGFSDVVPYTGTTFTWTNDNTSIGLGASGDGDIPSFVATNNSTVPITSTITVTATAYGCTSQRTFTITVNPIPLPPLVEIQCADPHDAYPYHRIFLTGLPVGGGMITDLDSGEKYPFDDPDPFVRIDLPILGGNQTLNFRLTDAYGCSVDFTVTICCPGLTAPTVKVYCIEERVEEEYIVMPHSEVVFTGFPSSDCTITQIRPSAGTGTLVTSDPFNLGSLPNGTYTYRITDKDGCSVDFTFVVNCHFWIEYLELPECGVIETAKFNIQGLPVDYWKIIPLDAGGGGGTHGEITPIIGEGTTTCLLEGVTSGIHDYEVYDSAEKLLENLSIIVPFPVDDSIQPSVNVDDFDPATNLATISFDHLPEGEWTIHIGSGIEHTGNGTSYKFENITITQGTYSVVVVDTSTNCSSRSIPITL